MQQCSQTSLDELRDMLSLSIWVYEVGEHFDDSNTELSFTYGIKINKLDAEYQKVHEYVAGSQQNGRVIKYVDDIKSGMQMAVTVNTSTRRICVAFRGSDECYDWMVNAKAYQVPMHGGVKVHAGFKGLIDSHEQDLNHTIDELLVLYPAFEIYLTGHSLGGALCTLYGYKTAHRLAETDTRVTVVAFASPCVGNYLFRQACDALPHLSIVRVTNHHDVVPALPLGNYYHVGKTAIFLHPRSACTIYNNYSYPFWRFALTHCYSTSDHHAIHYWRALSHLLERDDDAVLNSPTVEAASAVNLIDLPTGSV